MYIRPPTRSVAIRPIIFVPLVILFGIIISGCTLEDMNINGAASSSSSSSSITSLTPSSSASSASEQVSLYFGNTQFNPNSQICDATFAVARKDMSADATPEELLDALFAGPTQAEIAEGYTSFFFDETEDSLQDVFVDNGTAYVDIEDLRGIIPNASSSCGSQQFLAQIEDTLTQLPEVDRVVLAIDGNPQTLYDWLQIGCPMDSDLCDPAPFQERAGSTTDAI